MVPINVWGCHDIRVLQFLRILPGGRIRTDLKQQDSPLWTCAQARAKSNKEIGSNLFISETTVKGHLRNIFTKLNVLSRTEAVSVAKRRGLVQLWQTKSARL